MPQTEFRVLTSPLTKQAFAGRVRQDKMGYVSSGQRHNVTSDVFAAVVDIVGPGNTHVLSIDGVPQYEVSIKDLRPKPWTSCAVDPPAPGRYDMRHAGGNGYEAPVRWDGACWFEAGGEAIMFHPLGPELYEWRPRA